MGREGALERSPVVAADVKSVSEKRDGPDTGRSLKILNKLARLLTLDHEGK